MFRRICFVSWVAVLGGCCSARTQISPKGRDSAVITAASSSSDCCLKKAREEAQAYCEKKGGYLSVIREKTDHLKPTQVAQPMNATVPTDVATQSNLEASEDYQTTLTFRCR